MTNLGPEIYANLISRRIKLCSCICIFSLLSTLTLLISKFLTGKYQIEQKNLAFFESIFYTATMLLEVIGFIGYRKIQ